MNQILSKFHVGEKVLCSGDIPAEIRAIYTSRRGRLGYVVEYLSGIQRICKEHQLEKAPYGNEEHS